MTIWNLSGFATDFVEHFKRCQNRRQSRCRHSSYPLISNDKKKNNLRLLLIHFQPIDHMASARRLKWLNRFDGVLLFIHDLIRLNRCYYPCSFVTYCFMPFERWALEMISCLLVSAAGREVKDANYLAINRFARRRFIDGVPIYPVIASIAHHSTLSASTDRVHTFLSAL